MKKIPIIILFFYSLIFSQINGNNKPQKIEFPFLFDKIFFFELYTSGQDSNQSYFIYKVPLNRLLFEKKENIFKAEFSVSLELLDDNKNIVQREFDQKSAEVSNYEKTKSSNDYVEGIIPISFSQKIKNIIPTFTDLYTERVFKGKQIIINTSDNGIFSTPIIVKNKLTECNDSKGYEIANFGGDIPFSENNYDILLPVNDNNIDEIFVKIISNNDTLFSSKIDNYFEDNIDLKYCQGKILIFKNHNSVKNKIFILENFDNNLPEGTFKIVISNTSDFSNSVSFNKKIIWFDKPISLRNPELAIKYLNFIEEDLVIDSMLDKDSFQYSKLLNNYWKKFDPTPNTEYNPIMNEYYERIDYSKINFMPISRTSGVKTDRGKIYIKYGKPSEIKRTSNTYGQVTEIWIYNSTNKEFVFIDKYGIGDFSLITG